MSPTSWPRPCPCPHVSPCPCPHCHRHVPVSPSPRPCPMSPTPPRPHGHVLVPTPRPHHCPCVPNLVSPTPCPHLHVPMATSPPLSPCPHGHILVPNPVSPTPRPHGHVLIPTPRPHHCPCVPIPTSPRPRPCPQPHVPTSMSPWPRPHHHPHIPTATSLSPSPRPHPHVRMATSSSPSPCPHHCPCVPIPTSPTLCPHLCVPMATSLSPSPCPQPHVPTATSLSPSPRPHPRVPTSVPPPPRPPPPARPGVPSRPCPLSPQAMAAPRCPLSSLWLLSLVSLVSLPAGSPQCHRAEGDACSAAAPAPGAEMLGWGLDVTTLRPAGGQVLLVGDVPAGPPRACRLCPDPLAHGRPRRLPAGAGGWRAGRRCHQGTRVAAGGGALGTVVAGAEEVARGWRVGLGARAVAPGAVAVAGSHSRVAEFGLQRQREDRYVFASLELRCRLYRTWVSPDARPSPHFLRAVRALPPRFGPSTAADYGELLAAYGTHYIHAAELGGRLRAVTAIRSCRATMAGASAQEVADCLGVEVAAGGGAGRVGAMATACRRARGGNQGNASFNEAYSERLVEVEGGDQHGDLLYGRPEAYTRWLRSLPAAPGLVAAEVRPLHTLLPRRDPRRAALRAAIGHYVSWRALRLNCSRACAGGHLVGPCQCGCAADAAVTSECCSRQRGAARVSVWVRGGRGWRGDHFSRTDAYVRVIFAGRRVQTATAWNDERPRWGARFDWGTVALPPGARLRVEVWDEDNKWDDDLLGVCEEPLEAGGTRDVVCFPGGGRLEFSYRATCGPALGGPLCRDYVPQPPENDGGLLRASQWPPRPGDGPVDWPDQDEEEEEEEGDRHLEAFWGPPRADGASADPQELGFGDPPGDPLESTDAFGDLPEPLGGFGEGPGGVGPSWGSGEGPPAP
ncbi:perforin-1-like [Strix uralensis]|uniref:perforin-1-like n=1 Tax=Strix uralensis TaxID=36305 RepID=UPI003DA41F4F